MSFDNLLKLISILFIFLVACTSNKQVNTANSCIIFDQKKNWYKSTKKSYDNWKTPIALQLAIINQESSFNQFAKPERKKLREAPRRPFKRRLVSAHYTGGSSRRIRR